VMINSRGLNRVSPRSTAKKDTYHTLSARTAFRRATAAIASDLLRLSSDMARYESGDSSRMIDSSSGVARTWRLEIVSRSEMSSCRSVPNPGGGSPGTVSATGRRAPGEVSAAAVVRGVAAVEVGGADDAHATL